MVASAAPCCATGLTSTLGPGAVPLGQRPGGGAGRGEWAQGPHEMLVALQRQLAGEPLAAAGPAGSRSRTSSTSYDADPGGACRAARRGVGRRGAGRGLGRRLRRRLATLARRHLRAPRGPDGQDVPAAGPQVLAVGRHRGLGDRQAPAARSQGAPPVRAALAAWRRRATPATRDRLLDAALAVLEDAQSDRPRSAPLGLDREHLPEAAHRRRHPLDLRQLQRGQVRRPGPVVPGGEPRGPPLRRPGRRRHRTVCDQGFAEPHVGRHRALRAGSGRGGGGLARPRRQPATCSTPASAATTSRSASIRTCSSSWSTASPSSPRTPSSATIRCCTPCSATTPASARRARCRSTRSPRWSCAKCWYRPWACRRSTATRRPPCAASRCSTDVWAARPSPA